MASLENSRLPLRSHGHALELLVMGSNYYIKYPTDRYRREEEAGRERGRNNVQINNGQTLYKNSTHNLKQPAWEPNLFLYNEQPRQ